MPALGRDPFGSLEFTEDLGQGLLAVRGKLEGLANSVDHPTQHPFARGPAAITFLHLLERDRFPTGLGGDLGTGQDLVDGVQEMSPEHVHATRPALA